jgi:hypothetical protein
MPAIGEQPASGAAKGAPGAAASPAANMLARKRHAEAIATGWPAPLAGEQPQAAVVVPALEALMTELQSLAGANPSATAGAEPSLAHATSRELALVSLLSAISATLPASSSASQPRVAFAEDSAHAVLANAPAKELGEGVSRNLSAVLNGVKGISARASSALQASPTLAGSPPPVAAGGATGQVAPAAALIVLAAACALATRLVGRLATDPLAWQSALLSLRLERPG